MNGITSGSDRDNALLERIRRVLAHDLRTPLGTITNYAAILEYQGEAKPVDVRLFAGRIRKSAVRAALMLQHITDAIVLSERKTAPTEVDPGRLLHGLLSELSLRARFPANGEEPHEPVPIDSDLLAFAWRAFLSVNAEAAGDALLDVDVEAEHAQSSIILDLWVGARPAEVPARIGCSKFTESLADQSPAESCFALGLAEDLIQMRGGELGLWGRPGQAANMRVSMPRPH